MAPLHLRRREHAPSHLVSSVFSMSGDVPASAQPCFRRRICSHPDCSVCSSVSVPSPFHPRTSPTACGKFSSHHNTALLYVLALAVPWFNESLDTYLNLRIRSCSACSKISVSRRCSSSNLISRRLSIVALARAFFELPIYCCLSPVPIRIVFTGLIRVTEMGTALHFEVPRSELTKTWLAILVEPFEPEYYIEPKRRR